jgi:hypothetical protein
MPLKRVVSVIHRGKSACRWFLLLAIEIAYLNNANRTPFGESGSFVTQSVIAVISSACKTGPERFRFTPCARLCTVRGTRGTAQQDLATWMHSHPPAHACGRTHAGAPCRR